MVKFFLNPMLSRGTPFEKRCLSLAAACLLAAVARAEEVIVSTGAPAAEATAGDELLPGGEEFVPTISTEAAPVPPAAVNVADPVFVQAWEDIEAGRIREARRRLKDYLDEKPHSAPAWTLLGHTYAAGKEWGDAFGYYKKALKFDPHYAPAYFGKGEVFEKRGRLDEAVNEYRAATLCDPQWAPPRDALARLAENTAIPD